MTSLRGGTAHALKPGAAAGFTKHAAIRAKRGCDDGCGGSRRGVRAAVAPFPWDKPWASVSSLGHAAAFMLEGSAKVGRCDKRERAEETAKSL